MPPRPSSPSTAKSPIFMRPGTILIRERHAELGATREPDGLLVEVTRPELRDLKPVLHVVDLAAGYEDTHTDLEPGEEPETETRSVDARDTSEGLIKRYVG